MINKVRLSGAVVLCGMMSCWSGGLFAAVPDSLPRRSIHKIGLEVRPGYVIPTNPFFRGANIGNKPIRNSVSAHFKYAFQSPVGSCADRIYGGAYQGIGAASYRMDDREELGTPWAFYLLQGARIARVAPRLSLDYQWNLGLSSGWIPYDFMTNRNNKAIGSKINAYIDVNFYLCWRLTRILDFTGGIALTHFSNGNTSIPNAGLNLAGLKFGLVCNFNRQEALLPRRASYRSSIPSFARHMSYDLVFFGSWRRKGVAFGEKQIASPEAYPVAGFNFSAMYNVGYKLRLGVSLDGVYDGSANVYTEDVICQYGGGCPDLEFFKPDIGNQLALGLSGRVEYVMPYFTEAFGIGSNMLYGKGDLDALYQTLTLKIAVSRSSFLHIGYSLQDFQAPNFLMLGVGFRFNNKYPRVR